MSFNKWVDVKIEEICRIRRGASPRPIQDYIRKEGMPWVKISDATASNSRYIDSTKEYIKEEGISKSRFISKGTLVLSNSATPGIPKVMGIDACVHDGWLIVDTFRSVTKEFLYYTFINERERLLNLSNGSVFRNLKTDIVKGYKIQLPTMSEQKNITKVLTSLDDKIEVNNQINKTLENMAQTIFKHWFVDFEFPNEDGEPYKSSGGEMIESELGMIPKGWEVISLDKIVDVKSGYSYKGTDLSESNNAMVTIKNFDRNGGYKKDGLKEIIISDRVKKHHYIEINDVVVAHTDLTQGAEIIGNPVMVLSKGKYEKLIMSMDVVKVFSKDNDIDNAFIYCLLKTDNFKQYALGYVNGTTVLHLSKKAIPQYKLPFPTDIKICKELSAILKTIMMKISLSDNENDNLNLTRDILLPKLMSGKIRVPLDEEGDAS